MKTPKNWSKTWTPPTGLKLQGTTQTWNSTASQKKWKSQKPKNRAPQISTDLEQKTSDSPKILTHNISKTFQNKTFYPRTATKKNREIKKYQMMTLN